MRHLKLIAYSFFLISVVCVRPLFAQDASSQDTIVSDKLVIVTHPCTIFDSHEVAKEGINRLIGHARKNEWPTVILTGCETYVSQSDKLIRHASDHGELNFSFTSQEIYLAGGYFEWCLDNTLDNVLRKFWEIPKIVSLNYSIYIIADATYGLEVPPEKPWSHFGFLLKNDLDRRYEDDDAIRSWAAGWIQIRPYALHASNFNMSVSVYGEEVFYRQATQGPSYSLNIHFINTSDLK